MQVKPATFPVSEQLPVPAWIQVSGLPAVRPAFAMEQPVTEPPVGAEPQGEFQVTEETPTDPQQLERAALSEARAIAEAEGHTQGEAAGRAEWEERVVRLDELIDDLCNVRRRIFVSMESQMRELGLCVARTILERELRGDADYLEGLVRQALELVVDEDEIVISVAPGDRELLASRLDAIAKDYPRAGGLALREDATVLRGCLVDTRLARVDATLKGRLAAIAEALNGNEYEGDEATSTEEQD